jgi:hypothetical protein
MIESYIKANDNLLLLVNEFNSIDRTNFNEATTRFRFIDKILTDCLGWDHRDITVEDSYEGEYSDYTLHLFRPVAVL